MLKMGLISIFSLAFTGISSSQILSSDSIDTRSLILYYEKIESSEIESFKEVQLPIGYSLIPGIGTSAIYNTNTEKIQVFPSVSISLSQFIQAKRIQKNQKAKIQSIKSRIDIQYQSDIRKANRLLDQINTVELEINLLREKLSLQTKIHQYDSTQFANYEINPDSYYRSQLTLLSAKQNINLATQKLNQLKSELKETLKQ